jgi:hypothetical protein
VCISVENLSERGLHESSPLTGLGLCFLVKDLEIQLFKNDYKKYDEKKKNAMSASEELVSFSSLIKSC